MTYKERAHSILRDSIKSAIYIDEKARSFYETETEDKYPEESLSVELYNNFKREGISLDVHKYSPDDEKKADKISFFIDNRDLIILDWKLKGESGEEEALVLLSKIVKADHLHFCTIYTSIDQLDSVLANILSYFSSVTEEYHEQIKEEIENENLESTIIDILHSINLKRYDRNFVKQKRGELRKINPDIIKRLEGITGIEDPTCAITISSISLMNTIKSKENQPKPSFINPEKKIVVINNTIITILNKEKNNAIELLENYKNHIIDDVDSFNQLIGLELYNNIAHTGAMVNHDFVSFSKEALLYHRKKLKTEDIGHFFNSFMNEVFYEKIALSLRDKTHKLLDDIFLDTLEPEDDFTPPISDLEKMNLFYNALTLDKRGKLINFGDVFKLKEENKYLLCITPLCDCLKPQDKIKSNFYFAEGIIMKDKVKALELGDTAFISYLPNNIIVRWGDLSSDDEKAKYNPLYIKPYQYKVYEGENVINENNEITVHYLNKKGEIRNLTFTYITTIRANYTQRIANHAFTYPMRVGIDFVKK